MRSIAAVLLLASLLVLACGSGQEAASPSNAEIDAKTEVETKAPLEAKAGDPNAPVPGIAPPPVPVVPPEPALPPKAADDYGDEFCNTIIPCYQGLEFSGSFTAEVVVDIEPDGSVSAVSFTGEAPKPVRTCITTAIKNTKLAEYNGKPGRTRCNKSGQLMGGTQMVTSDRKYELRDAGAAKAEANAEANADAG
jgi:hypothetical protein